MFLFFEYFNKNSASKCSAVVQNLFSNLPGGAAHPSRDIVMFVERSSIN
jgi:hypothetical protein